MTYWPLRSPVIATRRATHTSRFQWRSSGFWSRWDVTASKIAPGAINSDDVEDGGLSLADFAASQVPRGAVGPRGAQGAKGDTGEKGDTGAQGEPGAIGPQ